jgi:hypothetical protein
MSQLNVAKQLQQRANSYLLKHGIKDSFQLKIKQPKNSEWVAMYRGQSQFTNRWNKPIFWLSPVLLDQPDEFIISVLHEYGHVIAEYAWLTEHQELRNLLSKYWMGKTFLRPWDEEEFAEEFAQFVYGRYSYNVEALQQIISLWKRIGVGNEQS